MTGYQGRDAVIVGAVRTPIGKGKASGALHDVLPADLLAHSLRELVERTGVDPAQVDDVIAGAVTQVGDQAVNIARNALLGAGLPGVGSRHHHRPPVWQQPASHQLRRPGRHRRCLRHGDRRRRGIDEPRPDGQLGIAGQRPVRRGYGRALSRRPGATGHQRRTDRREVGLLAHPARRVLRRQPRKGRPRHQGRAVRQRADPDRRAVHRRDHPARHHGGDAGRAASRRSTARR